jgi:hypothetical protein
VRKTEFAQAELNASFREIMILEDANRHVGRSVRTRSRTFGMDFDRSLPTRVSSNSSPEVLFDHASSENLRNASQKCIGLGTSSFPEPGGLKPENGHRNARKK